jgi:hypothetical protein
MALARKTAGASSGMAIWGICIQLSQSTTLQLHIPRRFSYDGLVSRVQLSASGYHPPVGGSVQE